MDLRLFHHAYETNDLENFPAEDKVESISWIITISQFVFLSKRKCTQ